MADAFGDFFCAVADSFLQSFEAKPAQYYNVTGNEVAPPSGFF